MLKEIRKGDVVARISHNRDVIFVVDRVINNKKIKNERRERIGKRTN